jgi:hypothetical protein
MLSKVEALQTAARRYCGERAEVWRNRFLEQASGKWDEKFELLRQRYRVLDVIRDALEALTPAGSASLEEARKLLLAAAASAVDEYLPGDHLPFEREVVQDEARLFAAYLEGLSDAELARVEPLPFRRVLKEAESARLWAELKARWGVGRHPMWYPFDRHESDEPPPNAQVFDTFLLDEQFGPRLREVLAVLGVSRLWQLTKDSFQHEYELDLGLLEPVSNELDERYWTDASFQWLIYASHEDTVTIAGAELLSGLRGATPVRTALRTSLVPRAVPPRAQVLVTGEPAHLQGLAPAVRQSDRF